MVLLFSRGKKVPKRDHKVRATESGYWKATGKERNVKSGSNIIGTKRAAVIMISDPTLEGQSSSCAELPTYSAAIANSTTTLDFDGEEDWFADIMKDDIIKLDDSSLNATPISLIPVRPESSEISNHEAQAAMSAVVPFQGTANRRLRLVRAIVAQCRFVGSLAANALAWRLRFGKQLKSITPLMLVQNEDHDTCTVTAISDVASLESPPGASNEENTNFLFFVTLAIRNQ
ncbi:hypothetical protein HAX54_003355 [Datura stramonium]|uniref:NAC domain-containing protein n=1 Tax=Datura stramonium TaxID=4076 RepID=A0ABS8T591_DATST|nr:hypothetical protein [Datura stramonium]